MVFLGLCSIAIGVLKNTLQMEENVLYHLECFYNRRPDRAKHARNEVL